MSDAVFMFLFGIPAAVIVWMVCVWLVFTVWQIIADELEYRADAKRNARQHEEAPK